MPREIILQEGFKCGELTVLSPDVFRKGKIRAYMCACSCGTQYLYAASRLSSNKISWCRNCSAKNRRDSSVAVGDVFGNLSVLSVNEKSNNKSEKYRTICKCICICGDISTYRISRLKTKRSTECRSCAYRKRPQSTERYTSLERIYKLSIISRCSAAGIENNLPIDEFEKLISKNCYYCDEPPRRIDHLLKNRIALREDFFANGVDRVDSDKGYCVANCVPCCRQCNTMKMSYSKEEFFEKIDKIYKKWIKQNDITKENPSGVS